LSTNIGDGFVFFSFELIAGECIGEASSSDFDDDDGGKEADDDDDVGEMRKSTSTSFLTFFLWIYKFMKFQYIPKLNSTFRS
jgi:hypothetical protein